MAVPGYQSLMLPLLALAKERGAELSTSEAVETFAVKLKLTEDDLRDHVKRIDSDYFAEGS